MTNYLHQALTEQIIRAFYTVYNKLGFGFQEKIYENSMVIEMDKMELMCFQQFAITAFYDKIVVGNYFADIAVEETVIVEIKAVEELTKAHEAQLLNYLKATNYEVGLLLNFGPTPKVIRKIFENRLK
ncbi:MAG: GxxExxY protein [Saprospiraceae bacterium]|nr:GxxExxY protein [Saprospiraceae bacterium]MCF8250621.1 GxxExxY protein [Saprospiraceae bacterium]MCF8282396.1 GxxExxY protein [Bacteroidales bacterium]MCF8312252.1 GxxExxY protein [Saprospiraceae bacterium]MCF8442809.1 GxxExxY protein [Saprospiraceae bacterium]